MTKGYWFSIYRSVAKPDALAAYAKLAGPAIAAGGGRFIVRGTPSKVAEKGLMQRIVLIEFNSLAQAIATYESTAYQAALGVLGHDAVDREIRFVEGAE
jgi:uncharacterized protein (DUF1330 family)